MNGTVPFISVVVPVLNGEATLEDCLTSILRSDYRGDRREIIVVDSGSTDATPRLVRRFSVQCVRQRGPSAAVGFAWEKLAGA